MNNNTSNKNEHRVRGASHVYREHSETRLIFYIVWFGYGCALKHKYTHTRIHSNKEERGVKTHTSGMCSAGAKQCFTYVNANTQQLCMMLLMVLYDDTHVFLWGAASRNELSIFLLVPLFGFDLCCWFFCATISGFSRVGKKLFSNAHPGEYVYRHHG